MRKKEFTGLYNMEAETLKSMSLEELKALGSLLSEMPDDVKAMYSDALKAYEDAVKQKEQYDPDADVSGDPLGQNAAT